MAEDTQNQSASDRPRPAEFFANPPAVRYYGPSNSGMPAWTFAPANVDRSEWVAIDRSTVLALLNEHNLTTFSATADKIAELLTVMLNTNSPHQAKNYGYEKDYKDLFSAVKFILKFAPIFIEGQAAAIKAGTLTSSSEVTVKQSALNALIQAARAVVLTHPAPGKKPTGIAYWHDDAFYLALILQSESESEIAVTYQDSSIIRFIESALNVAKVNHSGRRAISDELKRKKSDPHWGNVRGRNGATSKP